jgi:hypothetical protein
MTPHIPTCAIASHYQDCEVTPPMSSTCHDVAYVIADGTVRALTANDMRLELDRAVAAGEPLRYARKRIVAGDLRCRDGGKLIAVFPKERINHWRHHLRHATPGVGGLPIVCGCAGMSMVHKEAQSMLKDHRYERHALTFSCWYTDCRKHARPIFTTPPGVMAALEVTEYVKDHRIRSDLVYKTEADGIVMRIEVFHSHRAVRASRGDLPFIEVNASHVVDTIKRGGLNFTCQPPLGEARCPTCAAETAATRAAEMWISVPRTPVIAMTSLDGCWVKEGSSYYSGAKRKRRIAEMRKRNN